MEEPEPVDGREPRQNRWSRGERIYVGTLWAVIVLSLVFLLLLGWVAWHSTS